MKTNLLPTIVGIGLMTIFLATSSVAAEKPWRPSEIELVD